MNNLLIIGNGFDLAHGLKTSYGDFFAFLIENKLKDKSLFVDLFTLKSSYSNRYRQFDDAARQNLKLEDFDTKNRLFERLFSQFLMLNWCDVEAIYFSELMKVGTQSRYSNVKRLNFDFEIIRKYLEEYLLIEQQKQKEIKSYAELFRLLNSKSTMVLNFNYTNTVQYYLSKNKDTRLVHIHGQLENETNPIIFGYAADHLESRKLINNNDKEYMRYIKKHNYKRTNQELILSNYLESNQRIEVFIFGHSCGISDKLILNQIFNSKNVVKIRIFYHLNYEHFFETQVNIDRIMNDDSNFHKITNFQHCVPMPQRIESDNDLDFYNLINGIVSAQKRKAIEALNN